MIRTVIIDDEPHVRRNLKRVIDSNFRHLNVVGEGYSVETAVDVINTQAPDLVLLDINLSDCSGFNVLEKVDTSGFQVIFITAYDEYAVKAFRYNALDYLLKPIGNHHLKEAIDKVTDKSDRSYVSRNELKTILENFGKSDEHKKVIVRNSGCTTYVRVDEIIRCEADGNYTTLHLLNRKSVIASKPMKEYEALLPESLFFRVHQSHLVNMKFVQQYSTFEGENIIMEDGAIIPIARRRKEDFFNRLENLIS